MSAAKNSRIFEAAWAAGGRTNFPPEYLPPATLIIMKYNFIADVILVAIGSIIFRAGVELPTAIERIICMAVGILLIRLELTFDK